MLASIFVTILLLDHVIKMLRAWLYQCVPGINTRIGEAGSRNLMISFRYQILYYVYIIYYWSVLDQEDGTFDTGEPPIKCALVVDARFVWVATATVSQFCNSHHIHILPWYGQERMCSLILLLSSKRKRICVFSAYQGYFYSPLFTKPVHDYQYMILPVALSIIANQKTPFFHHLVNPAKLSWIACP